MSAETVAVPFQRVGSRQVLTLQQIHELPWLLDFIGRFPSCFQYDPGGLLLGFYPGGDAPQPVARLADVSPHLEGGWIQRREDRHLVEDLRPKHPKAAVDPIPQADVDPNLKADVDPNK